MLPSHVANMNILYPHAYSYLRIYMVRCINSIGNRFCEICGKYVLMEGERDRQVVLVYEGQYSVKCKPFHYPGSYISVKSVILCDKLC